MMSQQPGDFPADVDFRQMDVPAPSYEQVADEYREIDAQWNAAGSQEARLAALGQWDQVRRRLDTWQSLTHLRFQQDTGNPQYKQARQYCDQLRPKLTELEVEVKRKLVESPHRAELEQALGQQAFALWESDITAYSPVIEQEMIREAELEAQYTELLASARLAFEGQAYTLPELVKFREHPDRQIRHDAEDVRWQWLGYHGEELDGIFDELVRLRTAMAHKLGFPNYIGLAYKRMQRVDYTQSDVERFRQTVRQQVTPLGVQLRQQQAAALGLDRLMFWDESLHDPAGNPAPGGDHDWLLDQAQQMFDSLGGGLGDFFRRLVRGGLLDLKSRPGKAGGGFCTSLTTFGVPFIFANFNGTKGDVEVFTHEMGHAFQNYLSRHQPLADYLWPTYDACEIHSMSLEYLTWPEMERFFGPDAERFRQIHLAQSLLFLPYGVAVDHFQHLLYDRPQSSPAERHGMWQEMERAYLPWRDYGNLDRPALGGLWQSQRHIYLAPFYYIDYALAQTCALQFWTRSQTDFPTALDDYVNLCQQGGRLPFQQLVCSAGLVSPFEEHCLSQVVEQARRFLQD